LPENKVNFSGTRNRETAVGLAFTLDCFGVRLESLTYITDRSRVTGPKMYD
jgi:hypothetical protein